MFAEERRLEILKRVNQAGRVSVTELSLDFGVSEVTIRSDLAMLASQDLLVRTHGGAVPASRVPETSLALRRQLRLDEKERIGKSTAGMIQHGEAIFLDTSSTALALARNLQHHRDLTVLTNSLAVAQALINAAGVTVVMAGGTLQRDTVSLVGTGGVDFLRRFNIKKGFFGAHGIHYPEGLTDVCLTEAEVKREVLKLCRERIAIVDSSKWGRVGLASFANLEDFQAIVTNESAVIPPQVEKVIADTGILLVRV